MLKKICLFFCLLISVQIHSQEFTKYEIENVGSVDIPDDLELQTGDYHDMAQNILQAHNLITGDRIVFQQKGLNEYTNAGFQRYCRIIIETTYGHFEPLKFQIGAVSTAEINNMNISFKKQITNEFQSTNLKLLEFYGTKKIKINNQVCIKISYLRQLGKNLPVKVDMYRFQNKDRMHTLTVSYRLNEADIWQDLVTRSVNSFCINRIK